MKKLIIASSVLAIALTGCASGMGHEGGKHFSFKDHFHGMRHHNPADAEAFSCDKDAMLTTSYPNTDTAILNVTAPSLGLNNQTITLKAAVSGSGSRYVNDQNPSTSYEWHTKGGEGIFAVVVNGQEYSFSCQADHR